MSEAQLTFPTGDQLKEKGCAQVLDNNEEWKWQFNVAFLINMTRLLGGRIEFFTSENVLALIPEGIEPTHCNAVGAAMRVCTRKAGLVRVAYEKSTRPAAHSRVLAVWGLRP